MKSSALELHQAQRDRIIAETGYAVYDDFPGQDKVMPYVVMGDVTARDWSDKFKPGQQVISPVHIWSDYPGRKECATMLDSVLQALTRDKLTLGDTFGAVFSGLEMSEIIIDIDGTTRHGIIRLRYLIEEF